MKLEVLLSGLNNPQPAVRLDVVRVLGMLDEVKALPHLRERYQHEDDPQVRKAITWAGKRLFQAQQAGYSTLDEIFTYFRIDREIETIPDAAEEDVMRKMQDALDSDLRDMQQRSARRKAGFALAAGLGGAAVGLNPLGMALDAMKPGAEAAAANLGGPDMVVKRTPATAPTDATIAIWLKRLQNAAKPEEREQAIIELTQLNNPRALPHLALAFLADESPKVRQAAQRYGKILYWSAVYWDLERSGELVKEMRRRADALGKTLKIDRHTPGAQDMPPASATPGGAPPSTAPDANAQPAQPDIAEILRKAEEGRKRRKRDQ